MMAASISSVAMARTMASSVCIGFTVTRFMSTFLTRAICRISSNFYRPLLNPMLETTSSALVVALLASSCRDRLDRTLAGEVEGRRRESGEHEIGGTGRNRFGHRAIALVSRHRKVDALGLEVAGGRGEKQRVVIGQSLRAYDDALLRGAGLTRLAMTRNAAAARKFIAAP